MLIFNMLLGQLQEEILSQQQVLIVVDLKLSPSGEIVVNQQLLIVQLSFILVSVMPVMLDMLLVLMVSVQLKLVEKLLDVYN